MNAVYCTTQVKEITLSKQEVTAIVIENLAKRGCQDYDFDAKNPIVFWSGDNLVVRYVQKFVTADSTLKDVRLRPFPEEK